ncbi:hypothetical protein RJ640_015184 [Escallonia rubra]|uniref:Replication protein A 32 kDa subunit n=1 Tax=Escallonia rubra TaxID=112253 RepID=A0AA88S0X9_9ASTE|nr:hypothetical protein RJ640_015184 [Escallonia rubra]
MYGSQFDGNAAFSGGGFMPSQATQTADPSLPPAKNRDSQPLMPLTVKQIREAFQSSDDKSNFLIDDVDVNNVLYAILVKLVGMVSSKAERVTDVSFVIDDGTGCIDCNRWVNEAVDTKEMEGILPVIDYNEIANHFVESIFVHVDNTRLRTLQGGISTPAHIPNSAAGTPSKGHQAPSYQFSGQHNFDGLKGVAEMVLDYMQQPSCLEAIKYLETEGMAYSTVDECHYRSAVNG